MITLVTLSSLNDAFVLRSMLAANEIRAFIPDENTAQVDWGYINAIGGIRVQIAEKDSEKALSILSEFKDNLKRDVPESVELSDDIIFSGTKLAEIPLETQRAPRQTSLGVALLVIFSLALIVECAYLMLREHERKEIQSEAVIASNAGDYDLAIADFNRAIQLGGKSGWIYFDLGHAYLARGTKNESTSDYDQAIADFGKALELGPIYEDIYDNRGYAYRQKGQRTEAIGDYNQALLLNPKDESSYANRGIIYDDLGSYDLAIADYNRALELDPHDEITYINRARVY